MVQFADGEAIETRGELRLERINNELYVLGDGVMVPVSSWDEALGLMDLMDRGEMFRRSRRFKGCDRCKRAAEGSAGCIGETHPLFDKDPHSHC